MRRAPQLQQQLQLLRVAVDEEGTLAGADEVQDMAAHVLCANRDLQQSSRTGSSVCSVHLPGWPPHTAAQGRAAVPLLPLAAHL